MLGGCLFCTRHPSVDNLMLKDNSAIFMDRASKSTTVYLLQDHWTLQSQRQVLHAASLMSHLQQRAEVPALKKGLSALLLRGWMGPGRSIADFVPGQLLFWMLDAEVGLPDTACDSLRRAALSSTF